MGDVPVSRGRALERPVASSPILGLAGNVAWCRLVEQFFAFLGDPEPVESQVFQKGILFDSDGWDGKLPSACRLFS